MTFVHNLQFNHFAFINIVCVYRIYFLTSTTWYVFDETGSALHVLFRLGLNMLFSSTTRFVIDKLFTHKNNDYLNDISGCWYSMKICMFRFIVSFKQVSITYYIILGTVHNICKQISDIHAYGGKALLMLSLNFATLVNMICI